MCVKCDRSFSLNQIRLKIVSILSSFFFCFSSISLYIICLKEREREEGVHSYRNDFVRERERESGRTGGQAGGRGKTSVEYTYVRVCVTFD